MSRLPNHTSRWNVDPTTDAILRQVESLGYNVSVYWNLDAPANVIMRAMSTDGPHCFEATVGSEEGGDMDYRCACLLAEMVGVDLEDG